MFKAPCGNPLPCERHPIACRCKGALTKRGRSVDPLGTWVHSPNGCGFEPDDPLFRMTAAMSGSEVSASDLDAIIADPLQPACIGPGDDDYGTWPADPVAEQPPTCPICEAVWNERHCYGCGIDAPAEQPTAAEAVVTLADLVADVKADGGDGYLAYLEASHELSTRTISSLFNQRENLVAERDRLTKEVSDLRAAARKANSQSRTCRPARRREEGGVMAKRKRTEADVVRDLGAAVDFVNKHYPLPRCPHGSALMDHGGERLEPPCGCRAEKKEPKP
jgi:hypothetical protein